jgi:OOP family OmpA-OmpF porin
VPGIRIRAVAGVGFLTLLAAPSGARAQAVSGFAVDRFEPAGADSAWMTEESLRFEGHLRPVVALVADWAWKPLVVYDNQGHALASLVSDQLIARADAALMLWNRVRVDLDVPVVLVNGGDGTVLGTQQYAPPDGAALGDVRLGADGIVFQRPDRALAVALGLQLFLPTGRTAAFSGDGGLRVWPRVEVAGEQRSFAWAGRFGVQFRPSDSCQCDLAPGSELNGGIAGGWRPRPDLLVGPELFWSHGVSNGGPGLRTGTPLELLLGGHYAFTPTWTLTAGVGAGLTSGAGTPALRTVVGAAYAFKGPAEAPRSEGGGPQSFGGGNGL